MKTRVHPYTAPRRGLYTSTTGDLLDPAFMTGALNVRIKKGIVQSRPGYRQVGDAVVGVPLGLFEYEDLGGTRRAFLFTTKTAYLWNDTESQWVCCHDRTVADACETAWTAGTNVTTSQEGTIKKVGTYSCKLVIDAAFTTGIVGYRNDTTWGDVGSQDWTGYTIIGFWIRSDTDLAAGTLKFRVSDDAAGGTGGDYADADLPALTADQWHYVTLNMDLSDLNSVDSIALVAASDPGACTLYIDDIRVSPGFDLSSDTFWDCDLIRDSGDTEVTLLATVQGTAVGGSYGVFWSRSGSDLVVLNGSHDSSNIGSHVTKASFVCNFKGSAILADVVSGGNRLYQRLHWCDTHNIDNWDPSDGAANAGYVDLSRADRIVATRVFRNDYMAVVRERSIWLVWATGETGGDAYDPDQKVEGIGSPAGRTVLVIGDLLYFLGWDNVYRFDGIRCEAIADAIAETMFTDLNADSLHRAFAVHKQDEEEYWLFVPTGTATYPNRAYVFNYRLNAWTRHEMAASMCVGGLKMATRTRTIDELTGTIDEQAWVFDSRNLALEAPHMLLADSDGKVWQLDEDAFNDDSTAIRAYFDTVDIQATGQTVHQRINRIDVEWRGSGLEVYYSTDHGQSWTQAAALPARSMFRRDVVTFRASADTIRFRFQNSEANGWFQFVRANVYWQPGGRASG